MSVACFHAKDSNSLWLASQTIHDTKDYQQLSQRVVTAGKSSTTRRGAPSLLLKSYIRRENEYEVSRVNWLKYEVTNIVGEK